MIGDGDVELIFENGDFDTEAMFVIQTVPLVSVIHVNGWFQERTEAINVPGGEMEAIEASFTCATSQVGTVKNEMSVDIDGDTYTVKRKHNIGTGMSLIYLKTT